MNVCAVFLLVSVPHRYGGLSGSHASTAGEEVGARLQALRSELQTHKAELHLTARTDDVLTARCVVLHLCTTGGTGPDGGTRSDPLYLREGGGLAVLEELQDRVDAAVVVAAVRTRCCAFPLLQTLPAEVVNLLLFVRADRAHHAEVALVLSLHLRFTARTLLEGM